MAGWEVRKWRAVTESPLNLALRRIPKVDQVLGSRSIGEALLRCPRPVVVDAIRAELDDLRAALVGGQHDPSCAAEAIGAAAARRALALVAPTLRSVINATGVLIHTNLGRVPLGASVLAHAVEIAGGYSNLEYDLEARGRGDRTAHCESLLCLLTGAEAALVVNNNAAAMVLALSALASGHEAVVSRGELIEIGGGFRLPEVFASTGVRLVEVGTTNRTYLRDYEAAIGPNTRLLVKAHQSNFEMVGFTEAPAPKELTALGSERGVPTLYDLGSGALVDLTEFGLGSESVGEAIRAGFDLVAFSGDKLLGGPQAGILVGRKALIDRLRRFPLLRALRVDKLTFAALESTLRTYLDGSWREAVVLFQRLSVSQATLLEQATELAADLSREYQGVTAVRLTGRVGGGALPTADIPSAGLAIVPTAPDTAEAVERRLRAQTVPIVARIDQGAVLLDLRTVLPGEVTALRSGLRGALGNRA